MSPQGRLPASEAAGAGPKAPGPQGAAWRFCKGKADLHLSTSHEIRGTRLRPGPGSVEVTPHLGGSAVTPQGRARGRSLLLHSEGRGPTRALTVLRRGREGAGGVGPFRVWQTP